MGKTLAGVKYGKLTSFPKPRTYPKAGGGRAGPPMVDIKGKEGQKKLVQPERKARGGRFNKFGSVSERNSRGVDTGPTIGNMRGHGNFASHGIKRSR